MPLFRTRRTCEPQSLWVAGDLDSYHAQTLVRRSAVSSRARDFIDDQLSTKGPNVALA